MFKLLLVLCIAAYASAQCDTAAKAVVTSRLTAKGAACSIGSCGIDCSQAWNQYLMAYGGCVGTDSYTQAELDTLTNTCKTDCSKNSFFCSTTEYTGTPAPGTGCSAAAIAEAAAAWTTKTASCTTGCGPNCSGGWNTYLVKYSNCVGSTGYSETELNAKIQSCKEECPDYVAKCTTTPSSASSVAVAALALLAPLAALIF